METVLSTIKLLDDDALSIVFCTASEEQRSKLHIHTLIHAFCPDSSSGLAYYKQIKRKFTLLDFTTGNNGRK